MSDITSRLREASTVIDERFHHEAIAATMLEAAAEIEQLTAMRDGSFVTNCDIYSRSGDGVLFNDPTGWVRLDGYVIIPKEQYVRSAAADEIERLRAALNWYASTITAAVRAHDNGHIAREAPAGQP